MAVDWSKAPLDVLHLVAKKIATLTAMVRFGAVCKSWRSLVLQNNWFSIPVGAIRESSLPRLMLDEANNSDVRGIFDLASGKVFEIHLPEAQRRRCCGSSHGWVVTLGEDLEIHLLNPLSGEQVRLPPLLTSENLIEKAILTCSPNSSARIYLVVALVRSEDRRSRSLAYIRPGEDDWTLVEEEDDGLLPQDDIIYYKEHLYGVRRNGQLVTWDFEPDHKWKSMAPSLVSYGLCLWEGNIYWHNYLAEVRGEIVVIARSLQHLKHPDGHFHYHTHAVLLLKSCRRGRYETLTMIQSLGDCCLFLGGSSSMSISPVPQGCRPNCIYFTDNHYNCYTNGAHAMVGHDMGVFSLDDGKFEPFFFGVSDSYFSRPIWVTMNSSK